MYSISWKLYRKLQRNGWFKCSSILRSRIIFRTLSERTTVTSVSYSSLNTVALKLRHTFLFADIFQGKRKACVLPFNDPHFSKCALSNDTQEPEMIEVDW
jgi:hypothetical protein